MKEAWIDDLQRTASSMGYEATRMPYEVQAAKALIDAAVKLLQDESKVDVKMGIQRFPSMNLLSFPPQSRGAVTEISIIIEEYR